MAPEPMARTMAHVRTLAVVVLVGLLLPAAALAKGKVFFEDTIPPGKSSSVTFTVHKAASFRVLLRVPTQGRAKLFLTGKTAPKGGPLIDTRRTPAKAPPGRTTARRRTSLCRRGRTRGASAGPG